MKVNVDAIIRLIRSFCDLLNHRWNLSMRQSILMRYLRCLAKHGIPLHCIWHSRVVTRIFNYEEFTGKYPPTRNLKLFFLDCDSEYSAASYCSADLFVI
ncbi:hypothetical protein OSTOST_14413, partial [Ostertagia ostertagi]